jgi:hypothetical protein
VIKITQDRQEINPTSAATEVRAFDISGAVAYLRALGFDSASPNFVRSLVSRGQVPHIKLGKKFYVTRIALDSWLAKSEARR